MVQAKSVFGFFRLFEKKVWGDCVEDRLGRPNKRKRDQIKCMAQLSADLEVGREALERCLAGSWFLPSILEMACVFTRGCQR